MLNAETDGCGVTLPEAEGYASSGSLSNGLLGNRTPKQPPDAIFDPGPVVPLFVKENACPVKRRLDRTG